MYSRPYSIKKGIGKGLIGVLSGIVLWLTFTGFSDMTVWDLIVNYVKPVVGSVTAVGAFTMAINWLKFHTQ